MKISLLLLTVVSSLVFQNVAFSDDRSDALAVLIETLKCPVPIETKYGSSTKVITHTKNEYIGDGITFHLKETWNSQESSKHSGPSEVYSRDGYYDVKFKFSDIEEVKTSNQGKATVQCYSGKNCIKVLYVFNPDDPVLTPEQSMMAHGYGRSEERKTKNTYRMSLCDANAANDVKEIIKFLSTGG